jgi:predicted SAM-dependent methyltransferase
MSLHRKLLKPIARKTPFIGTLLVDRQNLTIANEKLRLEKKQIEEMQATENIRTDLARRYLTGSGIEIGALHMPLPLPPNATAKYLDYLPVEELRKQYPELKALPLVTVDIVDDGEKLSKVRDNSQNFIIANHMLEHCQDPIGTLLTFYKKLRGNGVLFMAIPDKRYTFDMYRSLTPYSHLLEEHRIHPSKKFYNAHSKEIAEYTELLKDPKQINERAQALKKTNYSIHYHVWTQKELVNFFYKTAEKYSLNFEIEAVMNNVHEVVFIIKKRDPRSEAIKINAIKKHYFGKKRAPTGHTE